MSKGLGLFIDFFENEISKGKHPSHSLIIRCKTVATKTGRYWSAGGNQKELASLTPSEAQDFSYRMQKNLQRLRDLPAVVIVAIDGIVLGGGWELSLCGDIRLATHSSIMDFKQLQIGLPTGFGGAERLSELTSLSLAQKLIFQSSKLNSHEAHKIGLFHEIFEDESELLEYANKLAQSLSEVPLEVLQAQKKLLVAPALKKTSIEDDSNLFASVWNNKKHKQSLKKWKPGHPPAQ
jgi:enoyl-CoA hydratase/carnithine racemase